MRQLWWQRPDRVGARARATRRTAALLVVGLAAAASVAPGAMSKTFPCPSTPYEPCKGPIEVATNYSGYKEGALSQIKLTLGPSRMVSGEPGEHGGYFHEVFQRQVSWHSVPDVEIVAAFILHRPGHKPYFRYQSIPTGAHAGHVTLTFVKESFAEPILIVQGRRIAASAAKTRTSRAAVQPKTVFQCQKRFKAGPKRSACVKRVMSEKPGASCAHPVTSWLSQTQEPYGDHKDMPIELLVLEPGRKPEAKYFFGQEYLKKSPTAFATYYLVKYSFGPLIPCHAKMRVLNTEVAETTYQPIPIPTRGRTEEFVVAVVPPYDVGILLEARKASGG
jgi:hypothetical protein